MTDPMTWVAAWLAGTSLYALNGWRKAQRARDIARDTLASRQLRLDELYAEVRVQRTAANGYGSKLANVSYQLYARELELAQAVALKIDAEDRLSGIERQRSETTRKGNATRASKRKALVDAKTAELSRKMADNIDRIAA